MKKKPDFEKRVGNTRVVSVTSKILIIFTIFILVSSFSTSYINLIFNRTALINLMKKLLVKDLRSIYEFCNIQSEIYEYTNDLEDSIKNIEKKGLYELENEQSVALGIKPDGSLIFQASKIKKYNTFSDIETLNTMKENLDKNIEEESILFSFNKEDYFGVYKYNPKWNIFILRAEELNEFYHDSRTIFRKVSIIIVIITLVCAVVGIFLLKHILRFIGIMASSILDMIRKQKLQLVDLKNAPNDNITFLGVAFNSLSNTIDNLVGIFRKFATRDIAMKAYREREIRLEGSKQELTILFSDIKSFTFITEILGTDIIKLLNMHYDNVIREILEHNGIIGSIIGDAILAVFGTVYVPNENKSYHAVLSAYKLHDVCESLRMKMYKRKEEIVRINGSLTVEEEKVFNAVLLEIGVGLDGGEVFYGNIGSNQRMTNTVIGDNVNSAARLEGLTRVYKIPVVCSEYIKEDIEKNIKNHKIHFVKIDKVQVKGKTIGKTIYWPVLDANFDEIMEKEIDSFSSGLEYYYKSNWEKAHEYFMECKLPLADVFKERTKDHTCPDDWNGIWTMETK